MTEEQIIKNTVQEVCKMINEHIQHKNPYDCLLVLKIKEHFNIDPNEISEIPCKTVGQ